MFLSLVTDVSCWVGVESRRFFACLISASVARITKFFSASWNLKLERAYLCSSQGFFFGRILTMSLFSIFFKIVWILRISWTSFVFSSSYRFFTMSLTSGK